MPIYECFFISNSRIEDFDNIECDDEVSLRPLFVDLILDGEWDAIEAWRHERLVCRVLRFADGRIDCSPECPARHKVH